MLKFLSDDVARHNQAKLLVVMKNLAARRGGGCMTNDHPTVFKPFDTPTAECRPFPKRRITLRKAIKRHRRAIVVHTAAIIFFSAIAYFIIRGPVPEQAKFSESQAYQSAIEWLKSP